MRPKRKHNGRFKKYKIFVEHVNKTYNRYMYVFNPYLTNDGYIGLYNSDFNDIYHSATGALSEAYEKFVLPVPFDIIMYKDRINILDIFDLNKIQC